MSEECRAVVSQQTVDGLALWTVLVMRSTHCDGHTKVVMRVAWFADWSKAVALAVMVTSVPEHPALGGVQWTSVTGRPSPRIVAERLAVIGRREPVPRIGLAAAMEARS